MEKSKEEIVTIYEMGCAMVIFTFDNIEPTSKNKILRNFASKSISQLMSIRVLNNHNHVFDSFIIYRSMLDRLAHLYFLERTNTFDEFEKWSFVKQVEANNTSLSSEVFKDSLNKNLFQSSSEEKKRYKSLKEEKVKWRRPDVENEFKIKNYHFLYQFGYDHASTHVHPMANDGLVEYFASYSEDVPEHISEHVKLQSQIILKNASLVSSLTITACLNSSNYKWRRLIYNFLETFNDCLDCYSDEFETNYIKMNSLVKEGLPLGEKY